MDKSLAFALLSEALIIACIVGIMFSLGNRRLKDEKRFWQIVFGGGIIIGNAVALGAVFGFHPPLVLLFTVALSFALSLPIASRGTVVGKEGQMPTACETRPIHLALLPTAIPSLTATALW
jgi:hypothetical protein